MHEPPAGRPGADADERLVFRRGRLRKREDDEVRMMREALANLSDLPRVKRILLELSRFYNPVADGPVIGPDTRRAGAPPGRIPEDGRAAALAIRILRGTPCPIASRSGFSRAA
jgi:hypothetical protein